MDHEGTVAGYFLDEPHADTAVLSITSFTTNNTGTTEAQHVVQEFLQACRDQSKKKLIIDVSSNSGGSVFLGYDIFKQACIIFVAFSMPIPAWTELC